MDADRFVVVQLSDSTIFIAIRTNHCEIFSDEAKLAEMYNVGIDRMKRNLLKTKILFMPTGNAYTNADIRPNFLAAKEITSSSNFKESKKAFYSAFVLKVFGKLI